MTSKERRSLVLELYQAALQRRASRLDYASSDKVYGLATVLVHGGRAQDSEQGPSPTECRRGREAAATSAKELKEVGEGYHDSMTLYFEEGFADGQNGRAELTQEPRTSVLIQQREDGSTYEKNLRVVAHKDQWRAAPSVEAEER
ncbi:hypothetical protein BC827DRAFT_1158315 [Russula dissimulans]|nr:hypothetical protein BC827DRAFT_1158315 [Russula dissimulans]